MVPLAQHSIKWGMPSFQHRAEWANLTTINLGLLHVRTHLRWVLFFLLMPFDSWTAVKLSCNHRKIRKEPWNLSSWFGQNLCDHAAQIHALSHARQTGRFIHRERNNIRMDDEICRRKSIAVVDALAGSTKTGIRTIGLNRHGTPRSLHAENGKCQVRACGSRCDTYIMYSWAPMFWAHPQRCSESLSADINENAFCKCHNMNDKMECCALC